MDKQRLQEIKTGDYLLHGTEEWTNQKDADTEAVILELIAALEASQQQLAEAEDNSGSLKRIVQSYKKDLNNLRALKRIVAEAQAEVKRLEDLYNSDRIKYLDDITLLQTEVGQLRNLYRWAEIIKNRMDSSNSASHYYQNKGE